TTISVKLETSYILSRLIIGEGNNAPIPGVGLFYTPSGSITYPPTAQPWNVIFASPPGYQLAGDPQGVVFNLDAPPKFDSEPATAVQVGQSYVFTPHVVDPDGLKPTFRLANRPVGMTIDPATGEVHWTP